jgi:hypothetical protein
MKQLQIEERKIYKFAQILKLQERYKKKIKKITNKISIIQKNQIY